MASPITRAGSSLNIRLPESPDLSDPLLQNEFQEIHNAIRILAEYLDVLRDALESQPGQTPDLAVRFRKSFWAPALQAITAGNVVSTYGTGIVNGVATTDGPASMKDANVTVGSTGSRDLFTQKIKDFYIALTDAAVGELVQCGVGPGILNISGAVCGQIVWAPAALSLYYNRAANDDIQYFFRRDLVGNGGFYLSNPIGQFYVSGNANPYYVYWEGYWMPGFPAHSGSTYQYNRNFLHPVGVCISSNYVLFFDYKRADSPPYIV